ncbi:MAG: hypothetical protein A2527_05100 [Candidatus Lambdaproteobacteria bacterium RIFOXYD2_FULL_50_16]|uniref:Coenzyme A biosynthesis bifunctional protein CoaBC n=1 Tax=Candidatus Lambdaproteobacteria bacterium RIFOXYD2_FULL_50_16 TaxID=1817772 RepID=A0A1F6G9T6_9PROT|nr:MAG: hypothetical protein A2527_05100 [Candidatus Lambdaproteobacteria bacterium RIFOXYD2_FULL_50_16]
MTSIPKFDSIKPKEILLGVTGSIAAYKALDLVRRLKERGFEVSVALSRGALEFVTPLSFAALSGREVKVNLFDPATEGQIDHIALARRADLYIVAPATANFLAKAAYGLADDYPTTLLLATEAPLLIAPAMNPVMYQNPANIENINRLKARGVTFVEPGVGDMACGEVGVGRLAEVAEIVAAVEKILGAPGPLVGKRVLVTAGPTIEPLDSVRFISNHSSGKMGYALAEAARALGAKVTLISGPVALAQPQGVERIGVETALQMREAVLAYAHSQDMIIKCAAVSDYRATVLAPRKLKKQAEWSVSLTANPDILAELGKTKPAKQVLVGFAAESENIVAFAQEKLVKKQVDLIIANDISQPGLGFKADQNQVWMVEKDQVTSLGPLPKDKLAQKILAWILAHPLLGPRLL